MKSTPTVFNAASEITVVPGKRGPLALSAPGYFYEITTGYGGAGMVLRALDEVETRPGFDSPLSYVVSGSGSCEKTVVHFSNRLEAERLIEAISAAQGKKNAPNPYVEIPRNWKSRLLSLGEFCGAALLVGFLGAAAANIGWNFTSNMGMSEESSAHATAMQQDLALSTYEESIIQMDQKAARMIGQQFMASAMKECRDVSGCKKAESDQNPPTTDNSEVAE
ncbi:hypothetical protein [Pseudomonas mosselii]|uniref:hypothetical protein n=1 Tax=Pseudomonas mosselii TaxID=78327 RepID=UPI0021D7DA87|nr:hypothetical protein [Pseudomonas mosselii]MCU9529360.1 hypothetical protein [Pseudomonas mosselii]MCU9536651.1 hypothetical protein [Pseudomonas mosselii]MCU9542271.1 hypothetical protein [Pseudomonas mosselii]MCU9548376.1 hypothetical protein [Pseudomonas mosselii]